MCIKNMHNKHMNNAFVVHFTTLPYKYNSDHWKSWDSNGKGIGVSFKLPNNLIGFMLLICKVRSWSRAALESTSSITEIPLFISLLKNASSPTKYGLSAYVLQKLPCIPLYTSLVSASSKAFSPRTASPF